jgi:hypothetical protein
MTKAQFEQIEEICEGMNAYSWSAQRTGRNTFMLVGHTDHDLCPIEDADELENDSEQQLNNWEEMAKEYGWQVICIGRNCEYGTVGEFKF